MTIAQIERYIGTDPDGFSKIFLKARTVEGIFIKAPDFLELKKKNFWRIVDYYFFMLDGNFNCLTL